MGRMLLLRTSRASHPVFLLEQFQFIVAKLPLLESSAEGGDVDYTNLIPTSTKQ